MVCKLLNGWPGATSSDSKYLPNYKKFVSWDSHLLIKTIPEQNFIINFYCSTTSNSGNNSLEFWDAEDCTCDHWRGNRHFSLTGTPMTHVLWS